MTGADREMLGRLRAMGVGAATSRGCAMHKSERRQFLYAQINTGRCAMRHSWQAGGAAGTHYIRGGARAAATGGGDWRRAGRAGALGCSESLWRLRSERRPNDAMHTSQTKGRTLRWTERVWRLRSDFSPNDCGQSRHSNLRWFSCTICTCFFHTPLRPKVIAQVEH